MTVLDLYLTAVRRVMQDSLACSLKHGPGIRGEATMAQRIEFTDVLGLKVQSRESRSGRNALAQVLFATCCLFVMAVSVHDAMLVVLNDVVICAVEQNPVGRWLIELQGGEVWLFVLVKLAGTAVACAVLVTLYQVRADLALAVSGGIALFQMALLCYLTFESPR